MAMFHHKDGWVVTGTARAISDLYTLVNRKDFLEEEVKRLKDQLQHEIENRLKLATSC